MRTVRRLLIAVSVLAATGWLLATSPGRDARRPTVSAPRGAPMPPAAARLVLPPPRSLRGTPASVTVRTASPAPPVPKDFLGLSFETSDLPRIARYADRGDLATLLRTLGTQVMRLGGGSADTRAAWSPDGIALPHWADTVISPRSLAGIGRLARETGWRVLLTLPLGHPDARAAAHEAAAARRMLGDRLAGVEIGNEPDAYASQGLRARPWSFSTYRREIARYRRALARAAPGVPLAGPDASSGQAPLAWVRAEARWEHPGLLTAHYYPSTRCGHVPRLRDLLSRDTRRAEAGMLARLAAISHRHGIPLRLGETNNISCKGQPGVSDAFASALWAVDYAVRAMRAGVAGMNVHDLLALPRSYAPLVGYTRKALARGGLRAKPEWYALLLVHLLIGDRPVHADVRASHRSLTATALLAAGHRLHVVLDDFDRVGAKPLLVRLHVPRPYATGTIVRLTAASPAAVRGVRLGGRAVAASGRWSPRVPLPRVSARAGTLALSMPPSSAALVTLSSGG